MSDLAISVSVEGLDLTAWEPAFRAALGEAPADLGLALNAVSPADAMWMASVSPVALAKALDFEPDTLAQSWRLRRPWIRDFAIHGILGRYFDRLEAETDAEACLQRGMHPGRQAGTHIPLSDLMPPLANYADEVFLLNGPYRDMGWQAAEPQLRITALLVESLGWLDTQARAAR